MGSPEKLTGTVIFYMTRRLKLGSNGQREWKSRHGLARLSTEGDKDGFVDWIRRVDVNNPT